MRAGIGDLLICLAAWAVAFAIYGVLKLLKIDHTLEIDEMAGFAIPGILGVGALWLAVCFLWRLLGYGALWPFAN